MSLVAKYAGDWRWSNYSATAGLTKAPEWLETDWTLSKFDPRDRGQAREDYRRFVAEARSSEYKPWESLVGQIYWGGEAFCDMVQSIISSQPRSREFPRAQRQLVRQIWITSLRWFWKNSTRHPRVSGRKTVVPHARRSHRSP